MKTPLKILAPPDSRPLNKAVSEFDIPYQAYDDGDVVPASAIVQVFTNGELKAGMTVLIDSAVITAAGQTVLWTPAIGKRARVMGFSIVVNPATTTAAGSLVTIQDGAVDVENVLYLGIAAPAVPGRWAEVFPDNGYLSVAPNNTISVNLSAALTAGGIYINIWGTEE